MTTKGFMGFWTGFYTGGKKQSKEHYWNNRKRQNMKQRLKYCINVKFLFFFFSFFFSFFAFQGCAMTYGGSQLGVKLELQLLAYATATAMPDPSHICDLHQSTHQCRILNLLSKARDRSRNLMDASQIRFCCVRMGTP